MFEGFETYQKYFRNSQIHANILAVKEEQFQEGFLRELFVNLLRYTINTDLDYGLGGILNQMLQYFVPGRCVIGVLEIQLTNKHLILIVLEKLSQEGLRTRLLLKLTI